MIVISILVIEKEHALLQALPSNRHGMMKTKEVCVFKNEHRTTYAVIGNHERFHAKE